ncbi:hypothetical protein CMQ_2240 [Grosmannia clavigera kw1407]|uniref:Uncharacterized protein n=1 Tax=Grosmannia clavigera (strain kw1407 / UAMH 11150) TaxID=655863 RepID=F0XIV9_GROCL|nr:uncharacterized protein CMQ_2240 [Grosmannia clavigera kw1407]EFX02191.1 hypothetical protein CMQ_2240 [Grosmannia clavigera kw1407]
MYREYHIVTGCQPSPKLSQPVEERFFTSGRIIFDSAPAAPRALTARSCSYPSIDGAIAEVVAGKSKGLVSLSSSNSSVGKTLTVKATAELFIRPLYTVSAGELKPSTSASAQCYILPGTGVASC